MTPLTEEWLRATGFRWHTMERAPHRHWLLWLGQAVADPGRAVSSEDLGLELTPCGPLYEGQWFCWIRADYAGRYTRLIHVRHLRHQEEVEALIAALTGFPFDPANVMYGSYHTPEQAARLRRDAERLDVRLALDWGKRAMRETGQDEHGSDLVRP